ncbi:hypothetical protein A9Q84_07295 [Halobacteriovorax marinus]|uniref:Major outer membrane protein n=1 Tax=Halobacteriovorax marinus TaxID=97084 RepID=A0A1Y5F5J5_9BACT|nr:hypothetical protein A9Q84_07295 [Halobacteriovorax marinus]
MKKTILIAGLAVLSTSAFATISRMQALGQDSSKGSHYQSDTRNIFRNAAEVNNFKNFAVTEWGQATPSANDEATAEGGFFREMGSFAYGIYLNDQNNDSDFVASATTPRGYANDNGGSNAIAMGDNNFVDNTNSVNLFFAGDMGVKWGARVNYSKASNETTSNNKAEYSGLGLGLGMELGDIAAYANLSLKDDYEGATGVSAGTAQTKFEGGGLNLGVSYNLMGNTIFVDYDKKDGEYTASGVAAKNETEQTIIEIGVGRIHEVSSTSRVMMDIAYKSSKAEDKDGTTATNNEEVKRSELPLAIGFETEATSWLTLRGSIKQNIFINKQEVKVGTTTTKTTRSSNTNVNAGATLNFGKLKVDGMIGTTNGSRAGAAYNQNDGVLALDNLLTKVAVHYWF